MPPTCKINGCDRPVKAGGMCRGHREKHLAATMYNIGPAKQRATEIINHYGTIGLAARMIGISRNTLVRIQHAELDARIQSAAYNRIMNHQTEGAPAAIAPPSLDAPVTGVEVAEYARTPEGQAFIAQCMAPKNPRTVAA